jgi:hypothetical protein
VPLQCKVSLECGWFLVEGSNHKQNGRLGDSGIEPHTLSEEDTSLRLWGTSLGVLQRLPNLVVGLYINKRPITKPIVSARLNGYAHIRQTTNPFSMVRRKFIELGKKFTIRCQETDAVGRATRTWLRENRYRYL